MAPAPEHFFALSNRERTQALAVAVTRSGRAAHLLEKDVWVVQSLRALFESSFATDLVFKGGTSLSKVYGAINRFSEDIDMTYSVQALIPDLVKDRADGLPQSRSQARKWWDAIRPKLREWIAAVALPAVQSAMHAANAACRLHPTEDTLVVEYEHVVSGYGYVKPAVTVEFGARSTGQPAEIKRIECDAASHLADSVIFPTASPRTMLIERTFWEKCMAAHVYCRTGKLRSERFARHWHDLMRLDADGHADRAGARDDIAQAVASYQDLFFREASVNYRTAVSGDLQIVPTGAALEALRSDYSAMVDAGMLFDKAESFDSLMEACKALEVRMNAAAESN